MAIKELKREWCPSQLAYVKEFLLHREEELRHMPRCSVGSKATVSETDNEYVKTTDGWKLLCDCDEDGGQGAGGGGGVQPDWNQNDPTAADYVKNRTHWVEGGGKVILPEAELVWDSDKQVFYGKERWAIFPEVGKVYTVRYNGVDYDCLSSAGVYGIIEMGNTSYGGWGGPEGNPDAPFIVTCYPNDLADSNWSELGCYVCTAIVDRENGGFVIDGSNMPVSLSIREAETVHTIDPKFLPSSSGGAFVVTFSSEDGETIVSDKTYEQTDAALKAGMYVRAQVANGDGSFQVLQVSGWGVYEVRFKMLRIESQNAGGDNAIYSNEIIMRPDGTIAFNQDQIIVPT